MLYIDCLDVIISINKGNSAESTGGDHDLEVSVNNLSRNDLSSSVTSLSLIRSIIKSPRNIFERLPPGRFGPKGTLHVRACV